MCNHQSYQQFLIDSVRTLTHTSLPPCPALAAALPSALPFNSLSTSARAMCLAWPTPACLAPTSTTTAPKGAWWCHSLGTTQVRVKAVAWSYANIRPACDTVGVSGLNAAT
jgi:hypothetical protein